MHPSIGQRLDKVEHRTEKLLLTYKNVDEHLGFIDQRLESIEKTVGDIKAHSASGNQTRLWIAGMVGVKFLFDGATKLDFVAIEHLIKLFGGH